MKTLVLFFVVACLFYSVAHARDDVEIPLPRAMAVLGDSISEGMLANFSMELSPSLGQFFGMILLLRKAKTDKERIDFFRDRYAAPDKSWAGGDNNDDLILSHLERLRAYVPDIQGYNFAVSGQMAEDLSGQVDKVFQKEEELGFTIDYLTVMVGGNDLAGQNIESIVSPFEYVGHFETNLRKLLDKDPDRRIFVMGLPDILKYMEETADRVIYNILGFKFTCKGVREMAYGDMLMFKTGDKKIMDLMHRYFDAYNSGTTDMIKRLSEDYPELDIKVVQNYQSVQYPEKTLSIDCFHPSEWGQAEMAEVTWFRGFWPHLNAGDHLMIDL